MTFVELTTTSGGRLSARPDAITAVWEISTFTQKAGTPTATPASFPGKPAPLAYPGEYGFQTRVEMGRGAGTFSVNETVEQVHAAIRRARVPRIFRRVRTVFAKEAS